MDHDREEKIEEVAEGFLLDIAENVWRTMVEQDLNQKQLAQRMGVTPGEVSQIIGAGRNFTVKKIAQIAVALGVRPHRLCEVRMTAEKQRLGMALVPGYELERTGSAPMKKGTTGGKHAA